MVLKTIPKESTRLLVVTTNSIVSTPVFPSTSIGSLIAIKEVSLLIIVPILRLSSFWNKRVRPKASILENKRFKVSSSSTFVSF